MPDQLRETVILLRDVLGDDLAGVYLHGSAVAGGLRPHSDLDVFAVSRRGTTDAGRRALIAGLLGISMRPRPLEVTVVAQDQVRPWRFPPVEELLYGEWLRAEFEAGKVPAPAPNPDLALLVTMVLRGDHPLCGPPPGALLDPVPGADVARACVDGIPQLLDSLPTDTRNVLLTFARIWATVATGQIRAKDDAADWVLDRVPIEHRPVLRHAKAIYRGEAAEAWPPVLYGRVRAHAEFVLSRVAAAQQQAAERH
ncbi:MAG: aminoglycoside adenylyltransferase family protein [Actinoplanes sp.]